VATASSDTGCADVSAGTTATGPSVLLRSSSSAKSWNCVARWMANGTAERSMRYSTARFTR
jgi:hypothetical protein